MNPFLASMTNQILDADEPTRAKILAGLTPENRTKLVLLFNKQVLEKMDFAASDLFKLGRNENVGTLLGADLFEAKRLMAFRMLLATCKYAPDATTEFDDTIIVNIYHDEATDMVHAGVQSKDGHQWWEGESCGDAHSGALQHVICALSRVDQMYPGRNVVPVLYLNQIKANIDRVRACYQAMMQENASVNSSPEMYGEAINLTRAEERKPTTPADGVG